MAELNGKSYPMGQVMEMIGFEVKAGASGATSTVPTVIGDPGIGKSASLKYLANQMNMDEYIVSLGALPMEWFSGLPDFKTEAIDGDWHSEGKTEVRVTEWTMSDLVRSINSRAEKAVKDGKQGLMVLLDDVHLVEPIVQKYLFEFFQNKTLQNFKLHEKAYLVAAMNGKDSAGLEGFLSAVINRMAFYFAEFDKDFWYENIGHTLHPYIASFAKGPNDRYFIGANATDEASPSPRAWTELSNMIPVIMETHNDPSSLNPRLSMVAESRVGHEAAVEFMNHVKIFQKFDFESIYKEKDPHFRVSEDVSDQILTAFMIRYIRSKEDAEYLKDILNNNHQRRTFISVLMNEFVTIYRNIGEIQDSKTKEGLVHLSNLLTSEDAIDSELIDIVMDSLLDIQS
jgi:hypothetical protein